MPQRRPMLLVLVWLAAGLMLACGEKSPKYPACGGDKDCKKGQRCINKKCLECGKDGDCADDEVCENGKCVREDAECASIDDCPDGQTCKNGACVACESNNECGPGGKCQEGVCERGKKCQANEDCADDEDCLDGVCQKPWQSRSGGADQCSRITVVFDYDQANIREDSREALEELAECLQKNGKVGVFIEGHADESGTEEYNIALSERRARAVADYLARLGIDPARFRVVPKGESELTGRGAERDRRVEFEWR